MERETIKTIAAAVAGLGVGFGVGFFVTKNRYKNVYAKLAAEEIHEIREHYHKVLNDFNEQHAVEDSDIDEPRVYSEEEETYIQIMRKAGYEGSDDRLIRLKDEPGTSETIDEIVRVVAEAEKRGIDLTKPSAEEETIQAELIEEPDGPTNIFEATKNNSFALDPEYLEAVDARRNGEPYVISIDEYMESVTGNDKMLLTYYEEDDTLVDDAKTVIPDLTRVVGPDALTMFGKFSQDHNIVYVRNEQNDIDFEIHRDTGSYTHKVLGLREEEPVMDLPEGD